MHNLEFGVSIFKDFESNENAKEKHIELLIVEIAVAFLIKNFELLPC